MRKVGKLLLYLSLIIGVVSLIYFRALFSFLLETASSKEGFLLSVFNRITYYFKHADVLNLIFLIVFLCLSLVGYVLIDVVISRCYYKVLNSEKHPNNWINRSWIIRPIKCCVSLMVLVLVFILLCNVAIIGYGKLKSTDSPNNLKPGPVLVLGTGKWLSSGKGENLYYRYRIQSAVELWKLNKVTFFIASGDRTGEHYDETRDIRDDLVAKGVPAEKIRLDTAGYRTLDSMLRIRQMYGTRELVIVTQPFHSQRALFLGKFYGMDGMAYNARGSATLGMIVREFFSKPKVIMDLILFNMQPKVQVANSPKVIQYREDFKVTSDLHVFFLIVLGISVLSTLGLVYKYID